LIPDKIANEAKERNKHIVLLCGNQFLFSIESDCGGDWYVFTSQDLGISIWATVNWEVVGVPVSIRNLDGDVNYEDKVHEGEIASWDHYVKIVEVHLRSFLAKREMVKEAKAKIDKELRELMEKVEDDLSEIYMTYAMGPEDEEIIDYTWNKFVELAHALVCKPKSTDILQALELLSPKAQAYLSKKEYWSYEQAVNVIDATVRLIKERDP